MIISCCAQQERYLGVEKDKQADGEGELLAAKLSSVFLVGEPSEIIFLI